MGGQGSVVVGVVAGTGPTMSSLRHGPPLALHGYLDKEGRKLHGRKTRYFKLQDSALFNHRRKVRLWDGGGGVGGAPPVVAAIHLVRVGVVGRHGRGRGGGGVGRVESRAGACLELWALRWPRSIGARVCLAACGARGVGLGCVGAFARTGCCVFSV